MQYLAIRVDIPEQEQAISTTTYLTSISAEWLYGLELKKLSQIRHAHWVIQTQSTPATINKWFLRNHFSRISRSVKPCKDLIKSIAYAIKDGVIDHSPDFPHLEEAREYDLSIKEDLTKKKHSRVIDELFEKCKDTQETGLKLKKYVLQVILDYHLEENKSIREFQIVSYAHTILCKLSNTYKESFIHQLSNRLALIEHNERYFPDVIISDDTNIMI